MTLRGFSLISMAWTHQGRETVSSEVSMYLKEKRDGRVKGQGCVNGRPQRMYIKKSESLSPTASLAGVIMTCVIDAYQDRYVVTVDIPGAFLQTKFPPEEKNVHVRLDGGMAEVLAKLSPETYQKYVAHKRGQAFIYCKLTCALYGTLLAQHYCSGWKDQEVSSIGVLSSSHIWLVYIKKIIDGAQCTIVWHVDNLKVFDLLAQ